MACRCPRGPPGRRAGRACWPTTTTPVSSLCAVLVVAGSTATTIRSISGQPDSRIRARSIRSRVNSAPSMSSSTSACSSCRPIVVPSYLARSRSRITAGRFAALSYVEPRVTCTCGSTTSSLISFVGFGVVETHTRGSLPSRRAIMPRSQATGPYRWLASSSYQSEWNCGPRSVSADFSVSAA